MYVPKQTGTCIAKCEHAGVDPHVRYMPNDVTICLFLYVISGEALADTRALLPMPLYIQ